MNRSTLAVSFISGVLALATAAAAPAQDTDRELRRENEALRSQVSDLQAELTAVKEENARLRAEIRRLQAALQQGGDQTTTPPPDELPVTIDETTPDSSPRGLRNVLTASYEEEMGEAEIGLAGSRERDLYLRRLERWRSRVTREMRSQIEWTVQVEDSSNLSRGGLVVVAVDPVSGARLGEPFGVTVPRGSQRRLEQLLSRRELDQLVLRGVLQPNLSIDPRLEQPGAFDRERFLAPFVTFGFDINATSLTPREPEADSAGG